MKVCALSPKHKLILLHSVYLTHQAFLAYLVWYSENMEEETAQFYSEVQTEQKYEIWCKCWYLCGQKSDEIMMLCNVNQWDLSNSIADTYIKL